MNFAELGLSEKTIQAINEAGITTPTTVQMDVIPSILAGKDVFTIAPSSCGKTCSYVFPLIEIISRRQVKNILIITAGSRQSVLVSDRFAVFNKYHEINQATVTDTDEEIDKEANVIIASPNQLVDLINEEKADFSDINILVVDDINLIKKFHQLKSLEKVLETLPADKQNIVFTNRRSKETQDILDKILKMPEEIKINRDKEQEAVQNEETSEEICINNTKPQEVAETPNIKIDLKQVAEKGNKHNKKERKQDNRKNKRENERDNTKDGEALSLMKKYRTFGRRTPEFLLTKVELAEDNQ